jgi:hypothetical protein
LKSTYIFALIAVIIVVSLGFLAYYYESLPKSRDGSAVSSPIDTGAKNISFTPWELEAWSNVKNRVVVYNADPEFTGNRVLQWISMRNSSSGDYYQKSMEYLCFWEGQGANGEWEAVVSIYNVPDSKSVFVVEVSRFTWHELQVKLDGEIVANFPQVSNDTVSLGYCTFRVTL